MPFSGSPTAIVSWNLRSALTVRRAPSAISTLRVQVHVGRAQVADRERVAAEVDGLEAVVHDQLRRPSGRRCRGRRGTARVREQLAHARSGVRPARLGDVEAVGQQRGSREASGLGRKVGAHARRRLGLDQGGHLFVCVIGAAVLVVEAEAWAWLVAAGTRKLLARRGRRWAPCGRPGSPRGRRARRAAPSPCPGSGGWTSIVIWVGACMAISASFGGRDRGCSRAGGPRWHRGAIKSNRCI